MSGDGASERRPSVELRCDDVGEAAAFFVDHLGMRIDAVSPADDPARITLSGRGAEVRLVRRAVAAEGAAADRDGWVVGRAGMRYRDLIPGRLDGRYVASRISIPGAGPVPDRVHYHRVRFQMIYCRRGRVRVVYEDQGEPFVMSAGDCVLQAPEIRHRVLESWDDLEVVEIASPADHETLFDHEMELPTGAAEPERLFGRQRFVRHVAAEAAWRPWRHEGLEARDLGFHAATGGLARGEVVRARGAAAFGPERHEDGLLFAFVLAGGLVVERDGLEPARLGADASFSVPERAAWSASEIDPGTELLLVACG